MAKGILGLRLSSLRYRFLFLWPFVSSFSLRLPVAVTLWYVLRRTHSGRSMATLAASGHGRNTRAPSQSSSLAETEEKRQGVQTPNIPSASEGRGLNPAASGATKKIGELSF